MEEALPPPARVLDLGAPNPFSAIMQERGYTVQNTEGDLDDVPEVVHGIDADAVTAFEIFEHLVAPLNVLRQITAPRLFATVPLRLWFATAYWNEDDPWDRHYHEFEPRQFDWLLEKAGWEIVRAEQWTGPVPGALGVRPVAPARDAAMVRRRSGPRLMRLLLVTYYFPPSGGAGVQRTLKWVKYLRDFGVEPVVLTVEAGAYPKTDATLARDVPPSVAVHRTRSLDPFGAYARLTGRSRQQAVAETSGHLGEGASPAERFARFVRANVFVPDARVGWVPFAVQRGLQLLRDEPFDAVLTSGPPHSVHLAGWMLQAPAPASRGSPTSATRGPTSTTTTSCRARRRRTRSTAGSNGACWSAPTASSPSAPAGGICCSAKWTAIRPTSP